MKNKHLHIVSFDIPWPANYGGVIDVYYKMKALSKLGIKIHLHCFEYARKPSTELDEYCHKVTYYPRNISKSQLFKKIPYIVASRSEESLLSNLQKDDHPILLEGLHTCFFLQDPRLDKKRAIVRTHNVEHEYYNNLASVEKNIFKRYYYYNEASKLESFEEVLGEANLIAAISPNDTAYFKEKYGNSIYLPAFHPNEEIQIEDEAKPFALYHGNLNVGENNEAALFLLEKVFKRSKYPLYVAGRKPSRELSNLAVKMKNVTLLPDLNGTQMQELIRKAQVNILPTFQPTGIKLKLLSALFNGKHCLVNEMMVKGTGLENLCAVATDADQMKEMLGQLFRQKFNGEDLKRRKEILYSEFSNTTNAQRFIDRIY